MKKIISILSIFIIIILLLSQQKNYYRKPISHSSFMFDTITTITLYSANTDKNPNDIINNANKICKELENKLSKTIKGSDIYNINNSKKDEPIQVSNETAELLQLSKKYYELSNGAFDITLSNISDIWNFKEENKVPPSKEEIQNILKDTGMQYINLNKNIVKKTNSNVKIDLGGIAKGYIADKTAEYLISENVTSAIINFGGNIVTIGSKLNNKPFNIGIQKPFSKTNEIIGKVQSKNNTVVTSGIYQRYFEYNNEIYHHIINPKTGKPAKSGLSSVTIEYSKSADADALSTACLILGEEKGLELINKIKGASAIFIREDGSYIKSENSTFSEK